MPQELISVIVPIFNVDKYLNKCVDSIINQTYKNIEILLVDDGSTDCCSKICDSYKTIDHRIRVFHKKNGGLSDARNFGIEKSQGAYIAFVDPDDYIDKDFILKLYMQLVKTYSDMAVCNIITVIEGTQNFICKSNFKENTIDSVSYIKHFYKKEGWKYSVAWNKLYKKSLFSTVRFPVNKNSEDNFVAHVIADRCRLITIINDRLYTHLSRDTGSIFSSKSISLTINNLDYMQERCAFLLEKKEYRKIRYKAFSQYILYFNNHINDIKNISLRNDKYKAKKQVKDSYFLFNRFKYFFPCKCERLWILIQKALYKCRIKK